MGSPVKSDYCTTKKPIRPQPVEDSPSDRVNALIELGMIDAINALRNIAISSSNNDDVMHSALVLINLYQARQGGEQCD